MTLDWAFAEKWWPQCMVRNVGFKSSKATEKKADLVKEKKK